MDIELNDKIKYEGQISKVRFEAFVKILKEIDLPAYKDEGKDGFLDLYNYWYGVGYRRFARKLEYNKERYENK